MNETTVQLDDKGAICVDVIDFQRDRLALMNAGIIDGVRNVVLYANVGHSAFSDDGGVSTPAAASRS